MSLILDWKLFASYLKGIICITQILGSLAAGISLRVTLLLFGGQACRWICQSFLGRCRWLFAWGQNHSKFLRIVSCIRTVNQGPFLWQSWIHSTSWEGWLIEYAWRSWWPRYRFSFIGGRVPFFVRFQSVCTPDNLQLFFLCYLQLIFVDLIKNPGRIDNVRSPFDVPLCCMNSRLA